MQALPVLVAQQLRASSQIADLTTAAACLVANSIDAGATAVAVDVSLASWSLVVEDNGSGIPPECMQLLGAVGCTSNAGGGGRGDSLAWLAQASQSLLVVSRARGRFETCQKELAGGTAAAAATAAGQQARLCAVPRQRHGTTVRLTGLLHRQPVRRRQSPGAATLLAGLQDALQRLLLPHRGVELSLTQAGSSRHTLRISKERSLAQACRQLLSQQADCDVHDIDTAACQASGWHVAGCATLPPAAFSSKDLQLLYLNGRAISCPVLSAQLRDWYAAAMRRLHAAGEVQAGQRLRAHAAEPGYVLCISCPAAVAAGATIGRMPQQLQVGFGEHMERLAQLLAAALEPAWGPAPPAWRSSPAPAGAAGSCGNRRLSNATNRPAVAVDTAAWQPQQQLQPPPQLLPVHGLHAASRTRSLAGVQLPEACSDAAGQAGAGTLQGASHSPVRCSWPPLQQQSPAAAGSDSMLAEGCVDADADTPLSWLCSSRAKCMQQAHEHDDDAAGGVGFAGSPDGRRGAWWQAAGCDERGGRATSVAAEAGELCSPGGGDLVWHHAGAAGGWTCERPAAAASSDLLLEDQAVGGALQTPVSCSPGSLWQQQPSPGGGAPGSPLELGCDAVQQQQQRWGAVQGRQEPSPDDLLLSSPSFHTGSDQPWKQQQRRSLLGGDSWSGSPAARMPGCDDGDDVSMPFANQQGFTGRLRLLLRGGDAGLQQLPAVAGKLGMQHQPQAAGPAESEETVQQVTDDSRAASSSCGERPSPSAAAAAGSSCTPQHVLQPFAHRLLHSAPPAAKCRRIFAASGVVTCNVAAEGDGAAGAGGRRPRRRNTSPAALPFAVAHGDGAAVACPEVVPAGAGQHTGGAWAAPEVATSAAAADALGEHVPASPGSPRCQQQKQQAGGARRRKRVRFSDVPSVHELAAGASSSRQADQQGQQQEPVGAGPASITPSACARPSPWRQPLQQQLPILSVDELQQAGAVLVPGSVTRQQLQAAQLLAQVDSKVLVTRCGGVLLAVDQHAADERVQLEELQQLLQEAGAAGGSGQQPLLGVQQLAPPARLQLHLRELSALSQHQQQLERWGWRARVERDSADESGSSGLGASVLLEQAPLLAGVVLGALDLQLYLHQLQETGGCTNQLPPGVVRVLRSKACRGAIMFGTPLSQGRCEQLLRQLAATQLCFCCAHGRPTTCPLADLPALHMRLKQRSSARQLVLAPSAAVAAASSRQVPTLASQVRRCLQRSVPPTDF